MSIDTCAPSWGEGWQSAAAPDNVAASTGTVPQTVDPAQCLWLWHQHQQQVQVHQEQQLQQQQQQYQATGSPPLYLVPFTAAAPAAVYAGSPADDMAPPAWGYTHAGCNYSSTLSPYFSLPYTRPTGFWLQGFYFTSYEHLMAYRRCAIAYNYHFFGIRPHFRPPAHLPRPRPPGAGRRGVQIATPPVSPLSESSAAVETGALAQSVVSAAAGDLGTPTSAISTVTSAAGPAASRGVALEEDTGFGGRPAPEEPESQCCSPGGSSTCDSDDTSSDVARGDTVAEDLLLHDEAQHSPIAVSVDEGATELDSYKTAHEAGEAEEETPRVANARGLQDEGRIHVCSEVRGAGSRGCAASITLAPLQSGPATSVRLSMQESKPPASPEPASAVRCSDAAGWGNTDILPAPRTPPPPLCPKLSVPQALLPGALRYERVASYGVAAEDCAELHGGGGAVCVGGANSTLAGGCPSWLEAYVEGLLGAVVGEALWGSDECF